MGQLAAGFTDLLVTGVLFKHWAIGFPEVAEASSLSVFIWNPAPEPSAGSGRTVSDYKCYDLPGSPAQSHPEPSFVRPFSDIRPAFIKFKDIILLSWPEPIGY